jgi:hypothetical protein
MVYQLLDNDENTKIFSFFNFIYERISKLKGWKELK